MSVILLVLLVVLILSGVGFVMHAVWSVALLVFIAWLIGFVVTGHEVTGGRRRWYRR